MAFLYSRKGLLASLPYFVCWMLLLLLLTLTGCTSAPEAKSPAKATVSPTAKASPTSTPTLSPDPGQILLAQIGGSLNSARTFHAIFNMDISGQAFSGTISNEVWNANPGKNRVEVRQSTVSQVVAGTVTVSDGQRLWQYDPQKNVVYTGQVPTNANGGQNFAGFSGGQSRVLLTLIQAVFTQSKGTQKVDTQINGRDVYDVHVISAGNDGSGATGNAGITDPTAGSSNYTGEVYIDKGTKQPIKMDLTLDGFGHVVLDLPTYEINPELPDSTFVFATPAGAQEQPLQQATTSSANSGTLTLAQAEKVAGYHLLSIPGDQADYALNGVTQLGTEGNTTFALHYSKGNQSFTIVEGKPLANLPTVQDTGVQVHGNAGSFQARRGSSTLAWTEKGVGIHIIGNLNGDQSLAIGNLLS